MSEKGELTAIPKVIIGGLIAIIGVALAAVLVAILFRSLGDPSQMVEMITAWDWKVVAVVCASIIGCGLIIGGRG